MQAPINLTPRTIINLTYYDKMSNDERHQVFEAYEYDNKKQIYKLTKPELLGKSVIKKLSEWEE